MSNKKNLQISIISGLTGAIFSALLFSSISPSNAAVSTSGYYVCANKVSGALRIAPTSNKCKSSEFRYFFTSTIDQTDSQVSEPSTRTYTFYAPSRLLKSNICRYDTGAGMSVLTDVYLDNQNKLIKNRELLRECEVLVNVP